MNLYLVDCVEEDIDLEFRMALFVCAETPKRAAELWDETYERGLGAAEVRAIPTNALPALTEGAVEWDRLPRTIVYLP